MKKWSYVAVAMMAFASSAALTSCIDNDEPFGIEQIRLATANLLDAKKAAVEAEAAAKSAQVEIAKINAEIEKLRIEKEKIEAQANADYRAAEARYLDALAEAEKLRAEGDKAVSEAEAARLRAEAAKKEAEADKWLAEAEKIRKEADARYQEKMQEIARAQQDAENAQRDADRTYAEAIYWFEKTKADNVNTWNTNLWTKVENAFKLYLQTIETFNAANKEYMTALNKLAEIEADLVWVEKGTYTYTTQHWNAYTESWEIWTETKEVEETGFISPGFGKKKALLDLIAKYTRIQEKCENNIALLSQYKTELETLNAQLESEGQEFDMTGWAELLAQYEEKLEAAADAVEQAKLEQQAVKADQAEVYAKPEELRKEYEAFTTAPIKIDPFSITPMPEVLSVLSAQWQSPVVVVPEGVEYYLAYSGYDSPVNVFQRQFNRTIRNLKLAKLDDNDYLWTEALRTEMARTLGEGQGEYAKAKAFWETARDVYNKGGDPNKDLLPLAAELDAAINAYNELATEGKTLQDAYTTAVDAENDAYQALTDATDDYNDVSGALAVYIAAQKAYKEAYDKAYDDYYSAQSANTTDYRVALYNIQIKKADLYHTYSADRIAYEKLLLTDATEAQLKAAEDKMDLSYQKYDEYANAQYEKDEDGNYVFDDQGYLIQINGAYVDQQKALKAANDANAAAEVALHEALYDATATLLAAEKAFNAAGGFKYWWNNWPEDGATDNPQLADKTKDPAYQAVVAASEAYEAAQKATAEAQTAKEEFNTELQKRFDDLDAAISNQVTELGVGESWPYNINPTQADIDAFINETADFVEASNPIMYQDANKVFSNAKWYVIETSQNAFGMLGKAYDVNNRDTYDWRSDEAILIENATDEVLLSMVDAYIRKMIIADIQNDWDFNNNNSIDEQAITQFEVAKLYTIFGAFGNTQDLLVNIAYADIVIANKDNSEIDKWINDLITARDAMLDTYSQKQEEAKALNEQLVAAEQAVKDLDALALANVEKAVYVYNIYNTIVNDSSYPTTDSEGNDITYSLKQIVEMMRTGALKDTNEAIKECQKNIDKTQEDVDNEVEELAVAKEKLEFYKYQLEQLEGADYAKVENPYKYEVEYYKAEVDRLAALVNFYYQRYLELQAEYDSAKKTANYPN